MMPMLPFKGAFFDYQIFSRHKETKPNKKSKFMVKRFNDVGAKSELFFFPNKK